MRSVPLALSVPSPTSITCSTSFSSLHFKKPPFSFSRVSKPTHDYEPSLVSDLSESGVCRASQVVDLFPTVSPEIVVREARFEDCWGVTETHCSSFFPRFRFPFDLMLRMNRLRTMIVGFSVPSGCNRTCLVAVSGQPFLSGTEYVVGILTLDTLADFLPRKGPHRHRRTGIAYVSNVAVREKFRRKGIAKRLVLKAEAQARTWGCRAIALHCDLNNPGATKLYLGQGFKCIKVPQGANWPQPKTSPDIKFNFMMKLVN